MIKTKKIHEITQIKLGRPIFGKVFFHTYCFYLEDILIDSGPPFCAHKLLEFVADKNISKIVNTHHHEDHVGANKILFDKMSIKSFASKLTAELLTKKIPLQFYRRLVWGNLEPCIINNFNEIIKLPSGRFLKLIPTPGHCDDHSCYFEENEGWLFTGDSFLHPMIQIYRKDENFHQTLNSLKKMQKLNPKLLFCSFNGRLSMARTLLKRKIEYMESIKYNTLKLYKGGYSIKHIRNKLLGKENSWYYLTSGHFAKLNLIKAILR